MADRAQRLMRRPATPVAILAGIALVLWWRAPDAPRADPVAGAEQTATVTRQPFVASVALTGTIVAGDAVDLAAPFDGAVRQARLAWGDRVTRGQVLAVLDTSELHATADEAEGQYLKALQDARGIAGWGGGTEVARARRAADSARADLADLDRRITETRGLLDQGLVARNELDALTAQRRALGGQAQGAREDLGATVARGGPVEQRIAALQLEGAERRLARTRTALGQAVIRAPWDGILVRPPLLGTDQGSAALHVGARLTRGQLIASIARSDALAVAVLLDEADVNTLGVGQAATVSGSGFPGLTLTGRVATISGEAAAGAAGSKARFAVRIALDPLPPAQRNAVRIGMSASITVTTYENPGALVVPAEAVAGAAPAATVSVRSGTQTAQRTVTIGRVGPAGVEIVSGLRAGETVVWTPPPAPDAATTGMPPS